MPAKQSDDFFIEDTRYISLLIDTPTARNDQSYQVLTTRGRIDRVYYKSAISSREFVELVDWVCTAVQCQNTMFLSNN